LLLFDIDYAFHFFVFIRSAFTPFFRILPLFHFLHAIAGFTPLTLIAICRFRLFFAAARAAAFRQRCRCRCQRFCADDFRAVAFHYFAAYALSARCCVAPMLAPAAAAAATPAAAVSPRRRRRHAAAASCAVIG